MRVLLREVTSSPGQTRIESICDLLILLNLCATDARPWFKMAAMHAHSAPLQWTLTALAECRAQQ